MKHACFFRISSFFVVGCVVFLLSTMTGATQQVGTSISDTGVLPNANAMLDVQSPATGDGKGLLAPRITEAQRTTASLVEAGGLLDDSGALRGGSAQGLLVYQIDGAQGFYYNTSTGATPVWVYVGSGSGDFLADGSVPMAGTLLMNGMIISNAAAITFPGGNVAVGEGALAFSSSSGSVAVGHGATARYRTAGVAIGAGADGDYNGIGIGYRADGQYSNIAIGVSASAYSGYDRIAIGRDITNRVNNSAAIRGSLYLDGGTGILVRATVGSGAWTAKAFTIPHPLDPDNKVLRHYTMEGPEVWNVYAGNVTLVNGRAEVELPAYYSALNAVGSEVYSLTSVGGLFLVGIGEKVRENRFVILGQQDGEVSWTIKVLRNDPALLEDLKRRPPEQLASELEPGQLGAENAAVNTYPVTP